jgi:hypothetical protein
LEVLHPSPFLLVSLYGCGLVTQLTHPMTHYSARSGPRPSVPIEQSHYQPRQHDEPMTQRTAGQLEGATLASLETSVGLAYERIKRARERMGSMALYLKRQKVDVDAYLEPGSETALRILRKIDEGKSDLLGGVGQPVGQANLPRIPWHLLRKGVPGHGILPPIPRSAMPSRQLAHNSKKPPPPNTPTIAQAWGGGHRHGLATLKGVGTHPPPLSPTTSNQHPLTTPLCGSRVGTSSVGKPRLKEWVRPATYAHTTQPAGKSRTTYFQPKPRPLAVQTQTKSKTTYWVPKHTNTTHLGPHQNP